MKTNYIILWAILSLTFSTLCYGQNQVRAYTLPLPLDPPKSRLAEFPSISIDSIIQTEAEDIVKEAMKDTKKNKKTGKQSKITNRTKGSITFVVDEHLAPIKKEAFDMESLLSSGSNALHGIFESLHLSSQEDRLRLHDAVYVFKLRNEDVKLHLARIPFP